MKINYMLVLRTLFKRHMSNGTVTYFYGSFLADGKHDKVKRSRKRTGNDTLLNVFLDDSSRVTSFYYSFNSTKITSLVSFDYSSHDTVLMSSYYYNFNNDDCKLLSSAKFRKINNQNTLIYHEQFKIAGNEDEDFIKPLTNLATTQQYLQLGSQVLGCALGGLSGGFGGFVIGCAEEILLARSL